MVAREFVDEKKLKREGAISVSSDSSGSDDNVQGAKNNGRAEPRPTKAPRKGIWGPLFRTADGEDRVFFRVILDEAHIVSLEASLSPDHFSIPYGPVDQEPHRLEDEGLLASAVNLPLVPYRNARSCRGALLDFGPS